mgnify:CR=1 FL=1
MTIRDVFEQLIVINQISDEKEAYRQFKKNFGKIKLFFKLTKKMHF